MKPYGVALEGHQMALLYRPCTERSVLYYAEGNRGPADGDWSGFRIDARKPGVLALDSANMPSVLTRETTRVRGKEEEVEVI